MAYELMITSVPKGLKPGSYGFCPVVCTKGMTEPVLKTLESLSGYLRIEGPCKPVAYSCCVCDIAGKKVRVLSRVADAEQDYSGRTNKIASHVVLSDRETGSLNVGPAALCEENGFFYVAWDDADTPRYLEPRTIANARVNVPAASVPNGEWMRLTGDPGWAGLLAATVFSPQQSVVLIVKPDTNVLRLFQEALALLEPDQRWNATFSTFFTKATPGVRCQWKAMVDGAYDAKYLRNALVIDLSASGKLQKLDEAKLNSQTKALVELARGKRVYRKDSMPSGIRPVGTSGSAYTKRDARDLLKVGDDYEGFYGIVDEPETSETPKTAVRRGGYVAPQRSSRNWIWWTVGVLVGLGMGAMLCWGVMAWCGSDSKEDNSANPAAEAAQEPDEPQPAEEVGNKKDKKEEQEPAQAPKSDDKTPTDSKKEDEKSDEKKADSQKNPDSEKEPVTGGTSSPEKNVSENEEDTEENDKIETLKAIIAKIKENKDAKLEEKVQKILDSIYSEVGNLNGAVKCIVDNNDSYKKNILCMNNSFGDDKRARELKTLWKNLPDIEKQSRYLEEKIGGADVVKEFCIKLGESLTEWNASLSEQYTKVEEDKAEDKPKEEDSEKLAKEKEEKVKLIEEKKKIANSLDGLKKNNEDLLKYVDKLKSSIKEWKSQKQFDEKKEILEKEIFGLFGDAIKFGVWTKNCKFGDEKLNLEYKSKPYDLNYCKISLINEGISAFTEVWFDPLSNCCDKVYLKLDLGHDSSFEIIPGETPKKLGSLNSKDNENKDVIFKVRKVNKGDKDNKDDEVNKGDEIFVGIRLKKANTKANTFCIGCFCNFNGETLSDEERKIKNEEVFTQLLRSAHLKWYAGEKEEDFAFTSQILKTQRIEIPDDPKDKQPKGKPKGEIKFDTFQKMIETSDAPYFIGENVLRQEIVKEEVKSCDKNDFVCLVTRVTKDGKPDLDWGKYFVDCKYDVPGYVEFYLDYKYFESPDVGYSSSFQLPVRYEFSSLEIKLDNNQTLKWTEKNTLDDDVYNELIKKRNMLENGELRFYLVNLYDFKEYLKDEKNKDTSEADNIKKYLSEVKNNERGILYAVCDYAYKFPDSYEVPDGNGEANADTANTDESSAGESQEVIPENENTGE